MLCGAYTDPDLGWTIAFVILKRHNLSYLFRRFKRNYSEKIDEAPYSAYARKGKGAL